MKLRYVFAVLVSPLILAGCYTNRAVGEVTSPDYNSRVEVTKYGYAKKRNSIGVAFGLGAVGAGAFAGYTLQPFKYQDGAEQKPMDALNAATGAVTGAAIVFITDWIFGKGEFSKVEDYDKWIKKVNKNYELLHSSHNGITIINPKIEPNFQIKNYNDLNDFKTKFPNSSYETEKINQAINVLSRSEIGQAVSSYQFQEANAYALKETYIKKSLTLKDLIAAKEKYPDIKFDYEKEGFEKIRNFEDAGFFITQFSNSKLCTSAFKKGLNYVENADQCQKLFQHYAPQSVDKEEVIKAKKHYLSFFDTHDDVFDAYQIIKDDVGKDVAIRHLLKKGLIENLENLLTIAMGYGYAKDATEEAVRNALPNIDKLDLYKITDVFFPNELEKSLSNEITQMYNNHLDYLYNESTTIEKCVYFMDSYASRPCPKEKMEEVQRRYENYRFDKAYNSNSLTEMKKYIDEFEQKPNHNKNLIEKMRFQYLYTDVKQNGNVHDFVVFAKKFPAYSKEMEGLSVKMINETEFSVKGVLFCNDFIKCFTNSSHMSDIKERREQMLQMVRTNPELTRAVQQNSSVIERHLINIQRQNDAMQRQNDVMIEQNKRCPACQGRGYDSWGDTCSRCRGNGRNN